MNVSRQCAEMVLFYKAFPELDLVEQLDWEDSEEIEFISIEEAGLEEEAEQAVFGVCGKEVNSTGNIYDTLLFFYDGDTSAAGFEE